MTSLFMQLYMQKPFFKYDVKTVQNYFLFISIHFPYWAMFVLQKQKLDMEGKKLFIKPTLTYTG